MKKYNLWSKLRSAMRAVWLYSPQHRIPLKDAVYKLHIDSSHPDEFVFDCLICHRVWPKEMAALDHCPPCGSFDNWTGFTRFCVQLFEGPVRVICKLCHKKITKQQRKNK